jgi:hydrogenase nickel incorporation protein HypA/HybF
MGIVQQVVEIATEASGGRKVTRIVLEIGKLSAVLPDALRFCFDMAAEDTVAEGAALDIIEVPGLASCRECGARLTLEQPFGRCGCGSSELEWLAADELKIKHLEVA